jgi:1-acyl-sn-glycerol-3-phosphate acyltransferase
LLERRFAVEDRRTRRPTSRLFTRERVKAAACWYMHTWHHMRVEGSEYLPPQGPALLLGNHASYLDLPALLAMDPYPDTTLLALASLFKVPILRQVLHAWDAIPVERRGRDMAAVRRLLRALSERRVVAVSVEGRRSRTGRLGEIHPVLAEITATVEVPIVPLGVIGSFRALPYGAMFPKRHEIIVRLGHPLMIPRGTTSSEARRQIRDAISALLPAEQQPLSKSR